MKTALLLVDLQNDFLPGGSLAIPKGNKIFPVINELLKYSFDFIVAIKDWHPAQHKSFAVNHREKKIGEHILLEGIDQILWPVHCVQNSPGADFSPLLDTRNIQKIFFKGIEENIDSYSTFFDNMHRRSTGLEEFLKESNVSRIFIAGLATDYCVKYSVMEALTLGFDTVVIEDACVGINLHPTDSAIAFEEMKKAGAKIIHAKEIFRGCFDLRKLEE